MPDTFIYPLSLSLVSLFICLVLSFLFAFRGGQTLYETVVDNEIRFEQIKGFSLEGYSITVSCQRRRYRRRYQSWYLPDKQYYIYYFYGEADEGAPIRLIEALKDNVSIPTPIHPGFLNAFVENEALHAYLDVIASRLRASSK